MNKVITGLPLCRGEEDLTLVIERLRAMTKDYEREVEELKNEATVLQSQLNDAREISKKHQLEMGDLIMENKKLTELVKRRH